MVYFSIGDFYLTNYLKNNIILYKLILLQYFFRKLVHHMTPNIPLYQKIYNYFRDQILSGVLKEGDCLPTEAELMEQFGVSRTTAKGALNALKADGYLLRRRGSGSYVAPKPQQGISAMAPRQIGFIVPADVNSDHFLQMMNGATDLLDQHGYQLVLYPYHLLNFPEREAILKAKADGCNGLIYYPTDTTFVTDLLCHLAFEHYPLVLVDKKLENVPLTSVVSDNMGGSEQLTRLLLEKGYRRFAFIVKDQPEGSSVTERYLGCCKAIHDFGLSSDSMAFWRLYSIPDQNAPSADLQIQQKLMSLLEKLYEQKVQVICAVNDYVALRVCRALNQLNISIPDQMAVTGFDDLNFTQFITPPLTTVRQNFPELGRVSAEKLIAQIMSHPEKTSQWVIPTQVVERKTT